VLPSAPHLDALVAEAVVPLVLERLASEVVVERSLLTTGLEPADAEERLGPWRPRGRVTVSSALVPGVCGCA
jgi:hypothetical protein